MDGAGQMPAVSKIDRFCFSHLIIFNTLSILIHVIDTAEFYMTPQSQKSLMSRPKFLSKGILV